MKYLKVDYTFVSITLEIFFNYYILIKNTLDSINTSEDIFITTEIVLDLVAWFKFEKKKMLIFTYTDKGGGVILHFRTVTSPS
jgi:hypothetical protein